MQFLLAQYVCAWRMNLISGRQRNDEHAFTHQRLYFVSNVTRRVKNQNWHTWPNRKWQVLPPVSTIPPLIHINSLNYYLSRLLYVQWGKINCNTISRWKDTFLSLFVILFSSSLSLAHARRLVIQDVTRNGTNIVTDSEVRFPVVRLNYMVRWIQSKNTTIKYG